MKTTKSVKVVSKLQQINLGNLKGGKMKRETKFLGKKGVSAVVATVLIIMITVAAVAIIWAAIIPMIRDTVDRSGACFDAQSDISLDIQNGYTCINTTGGIGNISLQVKKGPNTKISLVGVEAHVFVGGNSVTYRFNATQNAGSNQTGTLPGNNEEKLLYVWATSITNATKASIAPIVTVGKTEEVCDISQEVTLSPCA